MADTSPHFTSSDIVRVAVGVVGALVSLKFIKDVSPLEKATLFVGGAVLSYVGTPPVVDYLKVPSAGGLVGFMVGLFGMAVMTKLYEAVQLLDSQRIVDWFQDKFLSKKKD